MYPTIRSEMTSEAFLFKQFLRDFCLALLAPLPRFRTKTLVQVLASHPNGTEP